jgi:DNA-binding NarL/FixJ family response regulator
MPKSILIVDDHDAVRSAIRSLIAKEEDLRVCGEAVDGLEAIKKSKEFKPDLILLDLAMPKLNGIKAASVIKTEVPTARIVLFTLYELPVKMLGPIAGIDLVLSKRDGVKNLIKRVREFFASQADLDANRPLAN